MKESRFFIDYGTSSIAIRDRQHPSHRKNSAILHPDLEDVVWFESFERATDANDGRRAKEKLKYFQNLVGEVNIEIKEFKVINVKSLNISNFDHLKSYFEYPMAYHNVGDRYVIMDELNAVLGEYLGETVILDFN